MLEAIATRPVTLALTFSNALYFRFLTVQKGRGFRRNLRFIVKKTLIVLPYTPELAGVLLPIMIFSRWRISGSATSGRRPPAHFGPRTCGGLPQVIARARRNTSPISLQCFQARFDRALMFRTFHRGRSSGRYNFRRHLRHQPPETRRRSCRPVLPLKARSGKSESITGEVRAAASTARLP